MQLRRRLIHLINTGYYKPGDQLPTVRGLASELAINYNTVNKAYLSMIHDGYIASTRGRGVFVCELESSHDNESAHDAVELIDDCIDACLELGLNTAEIRQIMARRLQKHGKTPEQGSDPEEAKQKPDEEKPFRVLEGSAGATKNQKSS
ncbi:MAG: GntR family transcriptional regulator [Coriobacteriia bacterium]|nr:GntR family transcriptional regulator [Coriobacteriia bacterium]